MSPASAPKPAPVRTMLVDDHAVVRSGYRTYLEQASGFEVVAEADNAADAYLQYKQCPVDVVIMDIMLQGASGIEASRRILAHDPAARILVFSMYAEPVVVRQAFDIGVLGMLSKDSPPELLCQAALAVAQGRHYLGRDVATAMAFSRHSGHQSLVSTLSPREFEIFSMFVGAATIDDIAQALHLSGKTVANRLSDIRQKLGVSSDIQLLKIAASIGIVPWIGGATGEP